MANWLKGKRNRLGALLFALVCFVCTQAQTYNYMGYKYVFSATATANTNDPFMPQNVVLHPAWKASAGIGKMFSEKFMLELNGGYMSSAYNSESKLPLSGIAVGSAFKFFRHRRKGAVAPVGKYFGIEISFYQLKTMYDQDFYFDNVKTHVTEVNTNLLAFSFLFGKNVVVKDRLLFGIGTRFTVIPPYVIGSDHEQLMKNVRDRAWIETLIQGVFNMGYLF